MIESWISGINFLTVPTIMVMKYLLIVLDGGGDIGRETPLSLADKPNIDCLAKSGRVGLLDLKYERVVDSDIGYLKLLSSYSKEEYPGRGYLEALGIGLNPGDNDICVRGNFATLDNRGNIVDRRAGRDETGLEYFCELLDGMEIDGVRFTVRKSVGHRVVIVMEGKNLSDRINPNDPKRVGVPLPQVSAKSNEGKFTASVLNRFVYRVNKILSREPLNRKRRLPANTIIIRSTGKKKTTRGFKERFGLKGVCISAMPVARGVAGFLGMDWIEVPGATGTINTDLRAKAKKALEAVKKYDLVFLHINGTDIVSHDRKPEEKRRFIERIDRDIVGGIKSLDMKETVVIITCDHRTASSPEYKGYEHLNLPVPVLVSGNGIKSDSIE